MSKVKAAVFVEPGRIVLDSKPIPDVGPPDALMRVNFKLDEIEAAYEVFSHQRGGVLKVPSRPDKPPLKKGKLMHDAGTPGRPRSGARDRICGRGRECWTGLKKITGVTRNRVQPPVDRLCRMFRQAAILGCDVQPGGRVCGCPE